MKISDRQVDKANSAFWNSYDGSKFQDRLLAALKAAFSEHPPLFERFEITKSIVREAQQVVIKSPGGNGDDITKELLEWFVAQYATKSLTPDEGEEKRDKWKQEHGTAGSPTE